jgi:hypothetical protein
VDDRTPEGGDDRGPGDDRDASDPLVGELRRDRRHRLVLVVAAVIGIIAGAAAGTAFSLGAFGDAARGAGGMRNPAALIFFIGPPLVSMAIGHAIYAWLRRRRR